MSEIASIASQNLPLLAAAGGYFAAAWKDTASDVAALSGGNQVRVWKTMQFERLLQKAERIREERGAEICEVSPSIGVPLLEAASMETREEIEELWVRLIAAATDPTRANDVRLQYVEDLKRLSPLDAVVLQNFLNVPYDPARSMVNIVADKLKRRTDEIEVSFQSLVDLGFASYAGDASPSWVARVHPTAKAREIMRVLGISLKD